MSISSIAQGLALLVGLRRPHDVKDGGAGFHGDLLGGARDEVIARRACARKAARAKAKGPPLGVALLL